MAELTNKVFPYIKKYYSTAAGALLGYLYYYFIGCTTGSCPITSNPWISILYGGLVGSLLISKPKQKTEGEQNA